MSLPNETRTDLINDGLTLLQDESGFAFGTDALLLAAYLPNISDGIAVELGAGNGVISLFAAKRNKFSKILAVEMQEGSAALAKQNVIANDLAHRITVIQKDLRLLNDEIPAGSAHCVFSNPPYMKAGEGKVSPSAARQAARHEENGTILDFCRVAARLTKYGGSFVSVYRPDRLDALFAALRESGFAPKRMTMVYRDSEHTPSLVLTEAKRGGKEGLYCTPPLILTDVEGNPTKQYTNILEKGEFDEQYRLPIGRRKE
ncbi:MAG: methyltransferase domain-containing protein [Ruminococcaceae bacterium]|nr:methyltransferase domain-containing protein [Oscillospiraceae bacterium]